MRSESAPSFTVDPPTFLERFWERERQQTYWIAREAILRLLGLVYLVGFLTVVNDGLPLFGSDGLTPAAGYLERVATAVGGPWEGFLRLPSVFWLSVSDAFLMRVAWLGVFASVLVCLGLANGVLLAWLWFLYMSFVHVGQAWYGFGWEIQLLETGFLAIFLCPLFAMRARRPPPIAVIWLYRWLVFRVLLGAGLIKLRGDPCWRDLTCLMYHYETQPVPNPLSAGLHFMPGWVHRLGVLFSHLCELVAPFFVFGPRRARHVAGALIVLFQALLIASGNLSFLNWLTIVPVLACFDDTLLARVVPESFLRARRATLPHPSARLASGALVLLVGVLSLGPVTNLVSSRQMMNTSFDRLHLVNTYGAFGSVSRQRFELVFEGSDDGVTWRPYEFKCKPTDPKRRPCFLSPYHYRLDWLLWFAAMGSSERYPWAVHLVWKLLDDDPGALRLIDKNPFSDGPPQFVRIERYRYQLASGESDTWWTRERVSSWLAPTSRDDPSLLEFLARHGFELS